MGKGPYLKARPLLRSRYGGELGECGLEVFILPDFRLLIADI
jgi:hypothetical protein